MLNLVKESMEKCCELPHYSRMTRAAFFRMSQEPGLVERSLSMK